ncbi:glycosyltransferase family 2 protein [Paenibacillus ginsengarvi]|uniref:Glycosyltransferase family 2 protein n=2 Tax=Paenibacillus ginsengarvi TaxID=400777 RepID=A0A3B0CM14_9BACL|nr:glycosyltransferase family 2 protein [Paenibacillus ginsengarvi]
MLKSRAGKQAWRRRSPAGAVRKAQPPGSVAVAPVVSVVIPVVNERRTIAQVIRQAFAVHRNTEVIVVANGTTDGSGKIAESLGARVLYYPEPLGHDVGRSIGAKEAKGSIVLFTDGDIVISFKDMVPLVKAVENGVDIALNSYLGPVDKMSVHGVVLAKHALNIALSRPELKGASMTAIPHALSRKALEAIGHEHLAVPPKAQAVGICRGLDVRAVHYIDVGRTNRIRRRRQGGDPLEGLIVGDHLEALEWYVRATSERGKKPDLTRVREIVR